MKQKLILAIAIVSGIMAFWLTGEYLRRERARIRSSFEMVVVVVARRAIPAGTVIQESDLALNRIPKTSVTGRAVTRQEFPEIINKKLIYSLQRGAPILWSDIDAPQPGQIGLAETIRSGLRALSISVDAVSSVSGLVKPNDRVDVLGTFTFPTADGTDVEVVTLTILQDVTVLATGQEMARGVQNRKKSRARGYGTVTFEVTQKEAEMLVFAQAVKGRLTLTLRNPEDVSFEDDLPQVNFKHIQENLKKLNMERQTKIRRKTLR